LRRTALSLNLQEELADGRGHLLWLVAMGRMLAISQPKCFHGASGFRHDRIQLRYRSILIIEALNCQHPAFDSWKILPDIPASSAFTVLTP
jgi:hypothetical protein